MALVAQGNIPKQNAFSSTAVTENEGVAAVRQATLIRVAFRWVRIHHPKYPYQNKNTIQWMVFLFWWGMVDSNHRRHSQQIYSLSPLATREIPHIHISVSVCLEPVDGLV